MQELNVDELQRRMAVVREDLQRNSARLKENAQTLADWRYYVRRYPWAAMAAAGAIGFLLVPKRTKPVTPSVAALSQLAHEQGLSLQPRSKAAASNGLFSGLASMMTRTLLRVGMAYVGQQVGQALTSRMAAAAQAKSATDQPAGLPR